MDHLEYKLELTGAVDHGNMIRGQLVVTPHSHQQGTSPPTQKLFYEQIKLQSEVVAIRLTASVGMYLVPTASPG